MALDLYSPCPCGSGKKFKWCCQPIHVQVSKAFEQDANGQHEAALRTMDEVAAEHPGNPEVWGRKAQLVYQMGKPDDAEAALQKAFEINPNYPFGYYLKGKFRQHEGEIAGALILFRRAVELYDPEARELLMQLYALIADCELQLNRPLAARAALEIARRAAPEEPTLAQDIQAIFGEQSRFPRMARQEHKLQSLAADAPAARRAAWDNALRVASTGKLSDAAKTFAQLAAEDPSNPAARYNLALARAWLGDNPGALEALDEYVQIEPDENRAGEAWALGEVLRCGQGMEDAADCVTHSVIMRIVDPNRFVELLNEWGREKRLGSAQVDEETNAVTGVILEKVQALTPELAAAKSPHLGATFVLLGGVLRLWNTDREQLDAVVEEMRQRLGPALSGEMHTARGPALFGDILTRGLVFPVGQMQPEEAARRVVQGMASYLEETWVHQPLKSLGQTPPLDAAGHAVLRKKLRGIVHFLQECAELAKYPYDFERLRRKLGLSESAPAAEGAAPDIGALGAPELAALNLEALADSQLEEAYQAAQRLDARDLAGKFAQALVSRPARPDHPDRYPWHAHLVQLALNRNDTAAALDHLNEGAKDDCEHNEGRRRNDYELRRAQIHTKRGETDEAQSIFEGLIARVPDDARYRATAAEAMLSAKQAARARRFAADGLALARKQNNRDSEEHFKELLAATDRQG